MQINTGNKPPTEWPSHLQAKKDEAEARVMVHQEELSWLKEKLEKAIELEKQLEPERESGLLKNRKLWGVAKLRNGVLDTIAGQKCTVDKKGILYITEPGSPYDGKEVWRFKSLIINPMFAKHRHRERIELEAAKRENRERKKVPFPPAPTINARTKAIEYQGYSPQVLKKIEMD